VSLRGPSRPMPSGTQGYTDCRGCRNVSKLITAFRERDQVIIVMPYHICDDFRVSQALLT